MSLNPSCIRITDKHQEGKQRARLLAPQRSVYGWARAFTPLLSKPLEGSVSVILKRAVAIALAGIVMALGAPATAEVIQHGGVRVSVNATILPQRLPRDGAAPIHFSLATKIASSDGSV